MSRGILIGLGLAVLLYRLYRAVLPFWQPYRYEGVKMPAEAGYWNKGEKRD